MKFYGVTILQGVEFSIFPIDFEWALQQCSATALPVIIIIIIIIIGMYGHTSVPEDGRTCYFIYY